MTKSNITNPIVAYQKYLHLEQHAPISVKGKKTTTTHYFET